MKNIVKELKACPITSVVMIIAILAYLLQLVTNNASTQFLFFYNPSTGSIGYEFWRLLTPMFIHGGLLHIVFNCVLLYVIGSRIEKCESNIFYISLIIISSLAANILQATISDKPFGGLSGVGMGLLGYITLLQYITNDKYTSGIEFKQCFFWLALNLILGLVLFNYVANGAHIGGLVIGLVFAVIAAKNVKPLVRRDLRKYLN